MDAFLTAALLFGIGVVIILLLVFLLKANRRRGIKGERKVGAFLARKAHRLGGRLINDLYLPLYDKTTQIDHVLIAPFGVLVVETKNYKGEVYGNGYEKEWSHICGNERHKFYNPLMQNQTHVNNIRHIFSKEKIYNVTVDSCVVFADDKLSLNVPKGEAVYQMKKFKRYLRKSKFTRDNGVDVQEIYDTLMRYQVTDKKLLRQHNRNVRKMEKGKR